MKLLIVWDGINRMFKKKKLLSILMIIQCFVCTLLVNIIFSTALKTHVSVSKFSKFIGNKSYYWITDDSEENGDFSRYMKNQNGEYEKLKSFHQELKDEKSWTFLSADRQFITINSNDIPEKFIFQYEQGCPSENEDKSKKDVKCLHVSQNLFSEFGITVSDGREFKAEDFWHRNGECVPIILGNEYKNIFSIGQVLNGEYLCEDFKFEIIGFLPELTEIPSPGNMGIVSCDRYVIMPAFSCENNEEVSFFDKASLGQYVNGVIISGMNYADVNERVQKLVLKTGTMKFNVIPESNSIKKLTSISQKELSRLIYIFVVLTIFTVLSISITMNGFIRESYYEYGVHLLSGATVQFLTMQILGFISLIAGISFVLSSLVGLLLVSNLAPISSLAFSVVIVVLSSVFPISVVKKIDVNNLIRRQ